MLLAIIVTLAFLAFLLVLCVIYFDNIKAYFKKTKKSKQEQKPQQKKEINNDDFIPLKNQYDDSERDPALDALLSDNQTVSAQQNNEPVPEFNNIEDQNSYNNDDDLDLGMLMKRTYKKNNNTKKSIARQIKDLSPELKALLIDTTLKKRDDV